MFKLNLKIRLLDWAVFFVLQLRRTLIQTEDGLCLVFLQWMKSIYQYFGKECAYIAIYNEHLI